MKQGMLVCTSLFNFIGGFPKWVSVVLFILVIFMDIPEVLIKEHYKTKRIKIISESEDKKMTHKKFSTASCGRKKSS